MTATVIVSLAVLLCALYGIEGESPEGRRGSKDMPPNIPGMARLERGNKFQCEAVLIDELWVVASAFCVDSGVDKVVLHHCRNEKDKQCELKLPVARTVKHSSWDGNFNNDIALVMMKKPTRGVRKMNVANRQKERRAVSESSTKCYSLNWNKRSGIDQQAVKIRHNNCDQQMAGFTIDDPMCGVLKQASCQGETGNPTVCMIGGKRAYLFGIHAVEKKTGARCYYGLTRVSRYLPWFRNVMQNIGKTNVPTGGRCVPAEGNGRNPCQGIFTECIAAGFYSYRCQCMDGYELKDGQCVVPGASFGEACDTSDTVPCIDPLADCVDNTVTTVCACNEGSYEQDGICVHKRHGEGEGCIVPSDCQEAFTCMVNPSSLVGLCGCDKRSISNGTMCEPCGDGGIVENEACAEAKSMGEQCLNAYPGSYFAVLCGEGLVCQYLPSISAPLHLCVCELNYRVVNFVCIQCPDGEQRGDNPALCVESKGLGESCAGNGNCPTYTACTEGTCECDPGKFTQHGDACFPIHESPNGFCHSNEECASPMTCVGGRCQCETGYRPMFGFCMEVCPDGTTTKCHDIQRSDICPTLCDGIDECMPYSPGTSLDEQCGLDYASFCLSDVQCESSMGLICGTMGMCACRDGFQWHWDTARCIEGEGR